MHQERKLKDLKLIDKLEKPTEINLIAWEELLGLMAEAQSLDEASSIRLRKLENLFPDKDNQPDWHYFAVMGLNGALFSYGEGEIDFEKLMRIAWNCSLPLRSLGFGTSCMGLVSTIALKIKVKKLNAKSPPYSSFVKSLVVDWALNIEREYPTLPISCSSEHPEKDTVPRRVRQALEVFELHIGEGTPISDGTIYDWVLEAKNQAKVRRPSSESLLPQSRLLF